MQHINGDHKGISETRNLGISVSTSDWITFCDADDYYLPRRFDAFSKLSNSNADGFYEPVKSEYQKVSLKKTMDEVTFIDDDIEPEKLQDYLISHREQRISIIGLIVKRRYIDLIQGFDKDLQIGEDTDFIWKLSGKARLISIPNTSPKIVRYVHSDNTFQNQSNLNAARFLFYQKWNDQIQNVELSAEALERIQSSLRYYRTIQDKKSGHLLKRILAFFRSSFLRSD